MDNLVDPPAEFNQRDRALAHSLIHGVIRWQSFLDHIICQFSKTPFQKISLPVLNILRMGLFQLMLMDRIPEHAVVNTSVDLAKIFAKPYLTRFVNGLLREVIRSKDFITWPDENQNFIEALSVKQSYPKWLLKRWHHQWGKDITKALCKAGNEIPSIILRCNTLKKNRKQLIDILTPEVRIISPTTHAPDGICISSPKHGLSTLKSFQDGMFQVQDEAAQLIGLLVSPKPNETILDACAGRGGKTGHLAQLMNNQGHILAVDRAMEKLNILSAEMTRLGVSIVSTFKYRWKKPLDNKQFDRILIDAPCSGLGVIRRHPDMKWKKTESHIQQNAQKQKQLLQSIAGHLKPHGRLVYVVCSLEPEETTEIIENFLYHHENFTIEKHNHPILEPFMDKNGYFISRPDKFSMDGFFAVCLTQNSD